MGLTGRDGKRHRQFLRRSVARRQDLYVKSVRLLVGVGRIDAARLLREQLEAWLDELSTGPRPEKVSLLNSLLDRTSEQGG